MKKTKILIFKHCLLIIGLILLVSLARAQSVDEALRFLDVEKYGSATGTIKKVIAKDADEARNYYYAGFIYLNIEKPDSAKYYFNKGVSIDSKEPLNYVGQGFLALNEAKPQEAQILFDKALSLSKEKDAEVYNKISDALLHAETKDANKALTYLQKAIKLKKSKDEALKIDIETHLLTGDAYLALKDGGNSVTSYERALTLDSKLAKAHMKIGRIYLIPRNFPAAMEEFEAAVKADPTYAPVYKDLGELYYSFKKDVKKAKEMYEKYMALSDVKTGSRSRYAIFMYLTKDYATAIKEIDKALPQEPNNIVLKRLLGYSLFQTGDYPKAKAAMDKYFSMVKPDKTIATDYEYYGRILMKLGQDSLAVLNIVKVGQMDTANVELFFSVGEEFRKAKKFKESAKLYDVFFVRKKKPTSGEYFGGGYAYLYSGQLQKADTAFTKLLKVQQDNSNAYWMMAKTKSNLDPETKKGLAKPYYEKVIELAAGDKVKNKGMLLEGYSYMGYYYYLKENMTAARPFWDKVLELEPNNVKAKAFFDMLKQQKSSGKKGS